MNGRYFILGTEGSEFIVTDGKGIYKTNEQIIVSKLTTSVGEAAVTEVRTISFNDQDAVSPLIQLQTAYPNADIYLSGNLTVDFPEEIKLPILPDQYQVIEVMGSNVKLSWCSIEQVLLYLREQYAIGTLTAKIVVPKPSDL